MSEPATPRNDSRSPGSPQASLDTGSKEVVVTQSSRVRITPQGSASSTFRPQTARSSSSYQQFGTRGGRFSAAQPKSDVEWAMYRSKQSPGPGEYKLDNGYNVSGGKFNLSKPKTDVDWSIFNAKKQPGPGDYAVEGSTGKINGGRFSVSRPKTALEWTMHRAQQSPGPGEYDAEKPMVVRGGRFSASRPKSNLDWTMHRAKQSPGPGEYGLNRDFHPAGGKFNTSRPKTDVDWAILRAKQSPGPLDYDSDSSYRVSGGRFSNSRPKSALEWAIHKGKQQPGPGEYNTELKSISRLTGALANEPSNPSLPKEHRPTSAQGIPPEARRKPRPKPAALQQDDQKPKLRPSTSQSIPLEARRTPVARATSAPPGPRNPSKPPSPAISSSAQVSVHVASGSSPPNSACRGPLSRPESAVGERSVRTATNRPATASTLYTQASRRDPSPAAPLRPSSSLPRHSKLPRTRSISVQASEDEVGSGTAHTRPQSAYPRPSSRPNYLSRRPPQITTVPVRTSKRLPRGKRQGGVGEGAPHWETRSQLSDNARKLFDLAMQSSEFKRMMELYTGVQDPSAIIEKYAMMWSYQNIPTDSTARR